MTRTNSKRCNICLKNLLFENRGKINMNNNGHRFFNFFKIIFPFLEIEIYCFMLFELQQNNSKNGKDYFLASQF